MSAENEIHLMDSLEAEENLLLDFQLLLHRELTAKGWSRADLAKASGISTARLSQIFSSDANPTLKTCARLFHALGQAVDFTIASTPSDPAERNMSGWRGQVDMISNVHPIRPAGEKRSLVAALKDSIASSSENSDPQVVHWVTFAGRKAA